MNTLIIDATDETPNVNLNAESHLLSFSGKSLPEDVRHFYTPVLDWINEYVDSEPKNTVVDFKMAYFNTASSKIILDILLKLAEIKENGNNLTIKWNYKNNDLDMKEAGEEYSEIAEVDFEYVGY